MAKKLRILGSEANSPAASNALNLPVSALRPSPTNRTIDTTSEEWIDFVKSVKKDGIIQSLIVRHLTDDDGADGGLYEIIAGERRWRAAVAAELETVPCTLRDTNDPAELLGIQISENVQREDYEPLVLAAQLAKMRELGKSLAEIGAMIGKSEKRVSDLLALLRLSPELTPLFAKGYMPNSHVLWIARMLPAIQEQAARAIFKNVSHYRNGQYTDLSKLPVDKWVAHIESLDKADARPVTESELREWIKNNVNLKLSNAAWKLDDEALFPEAGPCTTCPQRSVNSPDLYAELSGGKDLCMNPACYQTKAKALVSIKKAEAKEEETPLIRISEKETHQAPAPGSKSLKKNQWVSAPSGKCEGITKALLVDGDSAGKELRVCTDVHCEVHKHYGIYNNSIRATETPEQKEKREAREAEEQNERKAELAQVLAPRFVLVDSLIEASLSPASALRLMLASRADDHGWDLAAERLGWGEVPRRWEQREERSEFIRNHLAELSDDKLSTVVLYYELADHLDGDPDDLSDEDNLSEFRDKLALLGVPSDQLAAFETTKGDN
jgi:ParB/RepB/Spo0J family partition protein